MKKKVIFTMCCLTIGVVNIIAQKEKSSYMSVNVNTSLTSLGFSVKELNGNTNNSSSKISFGFNANYHLYFNKHWGLGTGLSLSSYKTKAFLNGGMSDVIALGSYKDDDASGLPVNYNLRARVENIEEKQNIQFLEIPLAAIYQTRFSYGKWGAYGSIGVKYQIPASKKFEVVKKATSKLNVSGFYYDDSQNFDVGAPETPPVIQHGFGTLDNPGSSLKWKGSSELKTSIAVTFDAGAIYRLTNESDLCLGVYVDYGLTEIKKNKTSLLSGPVGNYHPGANNNIGNGIIYNSLLNSNHTNKVIPVSFGIKIGVRFKL